MNIIEWKKSKDVNNSYKKLYNDAATLENIVDIAFPSLSIENEEEYNDMYIYTASICNIIPYKKLGYVFYTFCIRFVYVFKKSTVFIRNWSILRINYTFLIIRFLYVFKNLIKNVELKTYNLYVILTNSL